MRLVETAEFEPSFDLETLEAVLWEYPVRLAILFGSRATGRTHERSDIDVAVTFANTQPTDPGYNDVFLGLSADLSDALETDDVDLVDLETVSPSLAEAVFDHGLLVTGDPETAAELRQRLTPDATASVRDRFDDALARIDSHLDHDDSGVPAGGESETDR